MVTSVCSKFDLRPVISTSGLHFYIYICYIQFRFSLFYILWHRPLYHLLRPRAVMVTRPSRFWWVFPRVLQNLCNYSTSTTPRKCRYSTLWMIWILNLHLAPAGAVLDSTVVFNEFVSTRMETSNSRRHNEIWLVLSFRLGRLRERDEKYFVSKVAEGRSAFVNIPQARIQEIEIWKFCLLQWYCGYLTAKLASLYFCRLVLHNQCHQTI